MAKIKDLLALLDLETLDVNLFRGQSAPEDRVRVFGGQVIAQALVAAARTVDQRICHSLHAYFLRGGDPNLPIIYEVDVARDGGSFSARRVVAKQYGKQIFNLAASFQQPEAGFEHAGPMPDVPPPDKLKNQDELRAAIAHRLPESFRAHFTRPQLVEIRPCAPRDFFRPEPCPPQQYVWFRAKEPIGDNPELHQCVLGYMSDMTLLETAQRPHGVTWLSPNMQVASLDHAMWFYHPCKADDWLLYAQESPGAAGGRGLNFGHIFTRDGQLVCSVAQEGLVRQRQS